MLPSVRDRRLRLATFMPSDAARRTVYCGARDRLKQTKLLAAWAEICFLLIKQAYSVHIHALARPESSALAIRALGKFGRTKKNVCERPALKTLISVFPTFDVACWSCCPSVGNPGQEADSRQGMKNRGSSSHLRTPEGQLSGSSPKRYALKDPFRSLQPCTCSRQKSANRRPSSHGDANLNHDGSGFFVVSAALHQPREYRRRLVLHCPGVAGGIIPTNPRQHIRSSFFGFFSLAPPIARCGRSAPSIRDQF